MKFQKIMSVGLAAVILALGVSGCGEKNKAEDGKIAVSIGDWPDKTNPKNQERYEGYLAQMKEKYPDIVITPDTYVFETKTFSMKASANQLPTMYGSWFTEVKNIIKSNYAADATNVMKKNGILDSINPSLLKMVSSDDGKVYGFPVSAYAQGLTYNKAIFKEAGLVNADGSIKIPDTYEELAEFSKIIRDKTGKAGIVLDTANNCGGWHFMNIAWSFGVNFMQQGADGKWKATFNTPEAVAALQYVKDLKWKYNALPDNTVIDQSEGHKIFGTAQAAMVIADPKDIYCTKFGMNKDDLGVARMPKGPAGRYAQTGGDLKMIAPGSTDEQIDACFKWLDLIGYGKDLDEQSIENKKKSYQNTLDKNGIVFGREALPVWVNEDRVKKQAEIAADYVNIDPKDFDSYYSFEDVTLRAEEPVACQQLYSVLDGCIQEVITNQNADPAKLIADACSDFQANHLDHVEQ